MKLGQHFTRAVNKGLHFITLNYPRETGSTNMVLTVLIEEALLKQTAWERRLSEDAIQEP